MKYKITNLYPSDDSSYAEAINNKGQVVGTFSKAGRTASLVYFWENGVAHPIETLYGKTASTAGGINAQGHIAGSVHDGGTESPRHAFLWRNGKIEPLLGKKRVAQALAINDQDEVVGLLKVGLLHEHAMLWRKGEAIDLGTLKGGNSAALGINSKGQVVGYSEVKDRTHAFLWWRGTMLDLGTLGGRSSEARGINEKGLVVGGAETPQGDVHAFVRVKGVMQDLGSPGKGLCYANAINQQGQIVGSWWPANKGHLESHALLWVDGKLHDLNDTLPKDSGWFLISARGINNHGQIVGYGMYKGEPRGFLLTPLP